jgi:inosose dehydratase
VGGNPLTLTGSIAVASAPVSFGAFEVTVGVDPHVPDASSVLDAVQRDGYEGIDLGPLGYLGTKRDLGERLGKHGLHLAGGYMAMPFSDPAGMDAALAELRAMLDLFDTVKTPAGVPAPKPTLADAGSGARRSNPGRAHFDRGLGLQPEGWDRLAANLQVAVRLCRERSYEPTFHHHAGTYVEAPWEIEELLARSDIGLCLDTGHLALGGGDPVRAIDDWGSRINHVHLKDIRRSVIDDIIGEGAGMMEVWRRGAFRPLGTGDLDIDTILRGLRSIDYRGWLVVEQDMLPSPDSPADAAAIDQDRNRAYLRARGL